MKISLFKDNVSCSVREVESMEELSTLVTQGFGWSPGIFKDNYRNLSNFQSMDVLALDFDKGMSLAEARLVFSGYRHIIGTSRSHQKPKPGKQGAVEPPCDRFRAIFALSRPIVSDEEYKATFSHLRSLFPAADPQCSDASRFFYPCAELVQGDNEGLLIEPVVPPPPAEKPKRTRELTEGEKGKLARSTFEFIALGTTSDKGRHASLFKAAKDLQEQGFDEADAEEIILRCPLVDEPGLPAKDFIKAVRSAFRKEPKYEPRGIQEAPVAQHGSHAQEMGSTEESQKNKGSLKSVELLEEALAHLANPEAVKGISTGWPEIDKLLGGLRQAELGIIQAYPKSGKTVLLTNLMVNLTGQGHKVGFASLEMHPAKQVEPDIYSILLKKDIRKGISPEDKVKLVSMLEAGRGLTYFKRERRPTPEEICDWAKKLYAEQGIRFIFIDHFHKTVPDESSVSSVAKTITSLTGLKYECPEMFVCLIVQPTKEQRGRDGMAERVGRNTLRGGASIFDECDWLINMHIRYRTYRETVTRWGTRRQEYMAAYPNDIREIEFEAIRAKPFSENMGAKLHMRYDKGTTEMKPHHWIAPPIEREDQENQEEGQRPYRSGQQSGWAKETWDRKKL